jgi:hypothetical protein
MLGFRTAGYQVGHRLGLAQVELAIEEGSLSKFSGLRQARTATNEQVQQLLLDIGGTVAGDLYSIVAGIGVWCTEQGDQDFVDYRSVIFNLPEMKGMALLSPGYEMPPYPKAG